MLVFENINFHRTGNKRDTAMREILLNNYSKENDSFAITTYFRRYID
jgi:hypothetical protein